MAALTSNIDHQVRDVDKMVALTSNIDHQVRDVDKMAALTSNTDHQVRDMLIKWCPLPIIPTIRLEMF